MQNVTIFCIRVNKVKSRQTIDSGLRSILSLMISLFVSVLISEENAPESVSPDNRPLWNK